MPQAAAIAAVVAAVAATAASVTQGVQASNAAKSNAANAEQQAKQAQANAQAEADQQREQNDVLKARQRVLVAASGIQPIGSPLDVMLESAKQGELKAQQMITEGQLQSNALNFKAKQYKAEGKGALTQGIIGGIGAGAGALAKMYGGK